MPRWCAASVGERWVGHDDGTGGRDDGAERVGCAAHDTDAVRPMLHIAIQDLCCPPTHCRRHSFINKGQKISERCAGEPLC